MNCSIPVSGLKTFGKALQTLSKLKDELYISITKQSLVLRSINLNSTVFCSFQFFTSFFTSFDVTELETESEENFELLCKVHVRSLLAIIKPLSNSKHLSSLQLELEQEPTEIVIKLSYTVDVNVAHKVHLLDVDSFRVDYSKYSSNNIISKSQCLSQVLSNFRLSDSDLGLETFQNKLIMRNFDIGELCASKHVRSNYTLNSIEFKSFKINQEMNMTISLKHFRAAVQFAEKLHLDLVLNFHAAGEPVVVVIKNPHFEANMVMATVDQDDTSTQSSLSTILLIKRPLKSNNNFNLTLEDKEALENVNWEEDFESKKSAKKDVLPRATPASLFDKSSSNETDNAPNNDEDDLNLSESPKSKRIKTVFQRCSEDTLTDNNFAILVLSSDIDSD